MENNPKQNNSLIILLSILLFISCIIAGLFAYQVQNLTKEIKKLRTEELVKQTPTPTPNITTEPLNDVPNDQIIYQTLKFFRPTNWSLWGNSTNTFSFAFDASEYSDPKENGNMISVNSLGSSLYIKDLKYDGGSRHKFISDNYRVIKTAKSYEKNYLIFGKPSLFIYNIDGSGECSVGAIFVSNTLAKIISSQVCESSDLEPILSTFKFSN